MKYWALSVLSGILLSYNHVQATMTLVSVTGISAEDLSVPTAPIIYAGFTAGCTGDGTDTCDSCTGELQTGSKLWTCNKKNAYPSLILTIRAQTTTTGVSASNAIVKIGGTKYTPTITPTVTDGILTMQLTWGEICNSPNVNKGNQCTGGSFATDLDVGFEVPSSGGATSTETLNLKIRARIAATDGSDWFYTDCRADQSIANQGACYFTVFPGDEKIYADNFSVTEGYPGSAISGINYTNVVFFYEPQVSGDDNATVSSISNKSPSFSLGVNTAASPPLADNRITGLSNNQRYCMVMANQDATGIISYFTPIPGVSGSPVTVSELCTAPAPVVGLLDGKSCFIATAAFGTDMAPEVQSFRDFRDKYLLSNKWGRNFVRFYYKHSPFYAKLIAKNEFAKFIVRGALWPLLIFARMTVAIGFWYGLLALVLMMGMCYTAYRSILGNKRWQHLVILFFFVFVPDTKAQEIESPPNEPPYVQEENEFNEDPANLEQELKSATDNNDEKEINAEASDGIEAEKKSEEELILGEKSTDEVVEAKPILEAPKPKPIEQQQPINPRVVRRSANGNREYIEHPLAAQGLVTITKEGAYIYRTHQLQEKHKSGALRFGTMDSPKIAGQGRVDFASMYSGSQQSILMFDYEWHPFAEYGKLGVQGGVGLLLAYGNGHFKSGDPTIDGTEAKEKYSFIAIPLSLGVVYRLEWLQRQWFAPYVAGGVSYIPVAEIRDDGNSTKAVGTPGIYGAGGVLFNISALNRETAFILSSEYSIANLWLSVDIKVLKTFQKDLDFNSNVFGGGIVVDY